MIPDPDPPTDGEEPLFPLPCSTERIEEFARRMAILADLLPRGSSPVPSAEIGAFARQLFDERRVRDELLSDSGLFGEPAWDIMLDLFAAGEEKRLTTVGMACAAAAAPPGTALRYLDTMIRLGLLEQQAGGSPEDSLVTLSPSCRTRLSQLLGRMIAARQNHGGAGAGPGRHAPRRG